MRSALLALTALVCASGLAAQTAPVSTPSSTLSSAPAASNPVTFSLFLRERTNATEWFAATPNPETYGHQDSMLRLGIAQKIKAWDYMLELGQSAELGLPTDAVSIVSAQGQLGLGGTYYASNSNNQYPAAASFRQGYARYHFKGDADTLRIGRFEFFEGQEMTQKNSALAWLQTNRVAQRLVGNFGFSNGQRSFDGIEGRLGGKDWNLTAFGGRAVQGVFNMNANPELNVDVQYLGYTRMLAKQRIIVRGFGIGYHDGRTGLTKTDNRTAAARALDHKNIRIGTYGGDLVAALPAGGNTIDFVVWGAGQFGTWGLIDHRAGAVAVEGGLRMDTIRTSPWLRGGYWRSTGDNNNTDGVHNTFFQIAPTPRVYARFPFYNLMNSTDSFVQIVDKPSKKLDLRTDMHFLKLTAPGDFWYQGGGAFDNKVFGFTGRPGSGVGTSGSFSSLYDISGDYAMTSQLSLGMYYAHAFGKTVVGNIYTTNRNANYGYFELTYKLQKKL
ncbi:Alginate export [Bryocella elongata]|uniref:Alginate export n=1 Tax=Bryocella elongata TaxID=863522 RepID=A0A1H6CBA5_9BACT|nr:alginate export family protein [Bryocella elongata]SEG70182.1 Alginate export [Bryocella elongata]